MSAKKKYTSVDLALPRGNERINYLILPKGVEVSKTGLKITAQLSYDEWQAIGNHLQAIHRSVLWWVGDWLR